MLRRIGMRAHDYGKDSMRTLLKLMEVDGYGTIQLALKKAIKGVDSLDMGLTDEVISSIIRAVKTSSCDISVFGAYLNYAHPDEAIRLKNVSYFKKHLQVMNDIGARVVGTETGSLDSGYKSHPENHGPKGFNRLFKSLESMVEEAERTNSYVAIEAVSNHIIHTPERMKQMIDAIGHPRLKVIFDPVNMITTDNYKHQEELMETMFECLSEQIVCVHAKDFIIESNAVKVVSPGMGLLNYEKLTDLVKKSPLEIDVLAENIPRHKLGKVCQYIKDFF